MTIATLPESLGITYLASALTFQDLSSVAATSMGNKAFVNLIWKNLLEEINPLLANYIWLSIPKEGSLAHKIAMFGNSLLCQGFNINHLSPTKSSISMIAELICNNMEISQSLISIYSCIPGNNPEILTGTLVEQACEIRMWMTENREILAQIEELDLSHLDLTTLPKELDIYFPSLKSLDLSSNLLTFLPDFTNLPALEMLHLGRNPDIVIPNFTNLPLLHTLEIDKSNLTSVTEFTHLPNLKILDLRGNDLTFVPDFSNLPLLHTLNLKKNKLTFVPDFSNLPLLHTLNLEKNKLTFVPDFSNLPSLCILDLSMNEITLVPDFAYLKALTSLHLEYNRLAQIPDFSNFPILNVLNLRGNNLKIVPNFHYLFALTDLYLLVNPLIEMPNLSNLNPLLKVLFSYNFNYIPTLSPWQRVLTETRDAIESLDEESDLRSIFLTMHELNTVWQRDLRADVIRAYNDEMQSEWDLLPFEWDEAALDDVYVINSSILKYAFIDIAWDLTDPLTTTELNIS